LESSLPAAIMCREECAMSYKKLYDKCMVLYWITLNSEE